MEQETAYTILAWCVAVPVMVWQFVPPLAHLFGYFRYTYEIQADSEQFRKEPTPAWLASTSKRLAEAGFEPLARVCVRICFDGINWRGKMLLRLYAGEGVMASVYQMLPLEAPRFTMYSIFQGNAVLITSSSMPEIEVREPVLWRSGLNTNDPMELLKVHRRRMLGTLQNGAVLVESIDTDMARTISQVEWDTAYIRSTFGAAAAMQLFMLLSFLFFAGAAGLANRSWLMAGVCISIACIVPLILRIIMHAKLTLESWLKRRRFAEAKKESFPTDHLIRRERAGS